MQKQTYNKVASFIYNSLVNSVWFDNYKYTSILWQRAWNKSCKLFSCPVATRIYGHQVILDYGHAYPLTSRKFVTFNNPLIELAYQCYSIKSAGIVLVDIGAGIGDTILLLNANCPKMIKEFYCVEGYPKFFSYLQYNIEFLKGVKLFLAFLSSKEGDENELILTQSGNASSQGRDKVRATTLDAIFLNSNIQPIDVLKIDAEGFDGKILCGAERTIKNYKPAIIFEWHPLLCQKTKSNWIDHFEILNKNGYEKFIWFNKYGNFSHFMMGYDRKSIDMQADFCLTSKVYQDWHYDIIALHNDSMISHIALAELAFATKHKLAY